jgi:tRNA (cytidine/uridine-2'-O-)-methyltransferase
MPSVALWEPEIAPNTGNIARTCVATGVRLHLIGRLGFRLDQASLRRAGVDCWEHLDLQRHVGWHAFLQEVGDVRIIPFSAHATLSYTSIRYGDTDCLLFGSEGSGLPESVLRAGGRVHEAVTIPMPTGKLRSINLSTSVGIGLYEALRQLRGC